MLDRYPVLFAALGGVISSCLLSEAVPGQTLAEPSGQTSAGEASDIIEEIIVTATRRESALQDTALSVAVLAENDLEDAHLRDFEDYWRMIPSMAVTDSGPFGTRVTLRGLSGNASARSDEALTAVYLDDTPLTPPEGFFTSPPDIYLVDIDRVEVLRGPQGTLFGASSMGGAVRTISKLPELSRVTHAYSGGMSSTHSGGLNYEIDATWNLPIIDERSAIRLAAYYRELDGYVDDIGLGQSNVNSRETAGFRLSARSRIGDNGSVTARVQYQNVDMGSFNEVDPNGKPEIGLPTTDNYQLALLVDESRKDTFLLYSLELELASALAEWTSITSYIENDADYIVDISDEMNTYFGGYLPASIAGFYDQQAFTQEFRVASSDDGPLDWLLGLFYLDQEVPRFDIAPAPGFNDIPFCVTFDPPPPANAPAPTCSGLPDGEEVLMFEPITATRKDYGVFGELGYRFHDHWEAAVGARWYQIEKTLFGTSSGFFVDGFDVPTDVASDEDGVNAKGSLKFHASDELMIYALASQGFRPGGANDPSLQGICTDAPPQYDSDSLWNYELGAKTRWVDNRVSLNATLYHMDWSDAQIVVASPVCAQTYVDNVGQATSEGIELELAALLGNGWDIAIGAGFTDAKLDEALPNANIDAPAGTELPNVPGMTASLAATRNFRVFDLPGHVRVDAHYTGSSYSDIDRAIRVKKPAYTLVDLALGIETDRWRTEIFVDNLLDEQAMLFCCRLNSEFVTNRPRTIGIRATYSR
jgi:outer membrane receptor protein involved in Fe transport